MEENVTKNTAIFKVYTIRIFSYIELLLNEKQMYYCSIKYFTFTSNLMHAKRNKMHKDPLNISVLRNNLGESV